MTRYDRHCAALAFADAKAAHIAALRAAAPNIVPCPRCGGSGEREDHISAYVCRACEGTGEVVGEAPETAEGEAA